MYQNTLQAVMHQANANSLSLNNTGARGQRHKNTFLLRLTNCLSSCRSWMISFGIWFSQIFHAHGFECAGYERENELHGRRSFRWLMLHFLVNHFATPNSNVRKLLTCVFVFSFQLSLRKFPWYLWKAFENQRWSLRADYAMGQNDYKFCKVWVRID